MSSEAQGKGWQDPPCDRRLSKGPEVPTRISFPLPWPLHMGDSAYSSRLHAHTPPWAVLPGCLGVISAVWASVSLLIKYEDWTKSILFKPFL